jgi:hypothetical protein
MMAELASPCPAWCTDHGVCGHQSAVVAWGGGLLRVVDNGGYRESLPGSRRLAGRGHSRGEVQLLSEIILCDVVRGSRRRPRRWSGSTP